MWILYIQSQVHALDSNHIILVHKTSFFMLKNCNVAQSQTNTCNKIINLLFHILIKLINQFKVLIYLGFNLEKF
jgi:hypothetical protein